MRYRVQLRYNEIATIEVEANSAQQAEILAQDAFEPGKPEATAGLALISIEVVDPKDDKQKPPTKHPDRK